MEGGGRPHEVLYLPRRNLTPLPSPLSNTLIPRDFLGQRPVPQDSRPTGTDSPRDLHSISLPSTPSPDVDTFSHGLLASKTMPSIANPHSPRPLHPKDANDTAGYGQREQDHPPSRKSSSGKKQKGKRPHAESNSNVRDPSSTIPSNHALSRSMPSPPSSPTSTNVTGKDERKAARIAVPRNPSIDSAVSSVSSSAEHSHKSSNESTLANSPEVQQLISTAGSAENLISLLLKEKQHAASQNAQLWKLVDKQRSLLMGLNQDLERAVKEKDRYRKKLKELQAQAHVPAPSESHAPEQPQRMVEEKNPEPQQVPKKDEASQLQALISTHNNPSVHSPQSSPLEPSLLPSPLHLLPNQQKAQVSNTKGTSEVKEKQHKPAPAPKHASSNASAGSDQHQLATQKPDLEAGESFLTSPSPTQTQTRSEETGSASTSVDPKAAPMQAIESKPIAERLERPPPPTRKPPPAPLNLKHAKPNSTVSQNLVPVVHSESEYDESQEVQKKGRSERGRRKTREEDDRDRELAAQAAQKPRSRSSKSSKSSKSGKKKSKHESKNEASAKADATVAANASTPSQKQVAVAPSVEDTLGGLPAPNSIAAVLAPNAPAAAAVVERTVVVPPMSPGLPVSPRPMDRPLGSPMPRLPREGSGIPLAPPMSPRGAGVGLPLSPRPPRATVSSPQPHQQAFPQPGSPKKQEICQPTVKTSLDEQRLESKSSPLSPFHGVQIDRSLMDPDHPNLLLPPNALPSIVIKVSSSRLRPKRQSYVVVKANDEDPVFTLSIFSRSKGKELWRVEKVIMALPQLDQQMRNVVNLSAKLPDRKLFSGQSPAVVDARRTALNLYFAEVLEAATDERSALVVCHFLSNDVIEARDDETSMLSPTQRSKPALALGPDGRPVKEGYLTKRGKNFGGWKVRYFVLQGPELKYFEAPGGTHLGTIKLHNAQIGKQTQTPSPSRTDDDIENQYRHAFLVLEPKRKDSSSFVRHVLCAESDQERDEWVSFLMQNVDHSDDEQNKPRTQRTGEDGKVHATGSETKVKQTAENQDAPAPSDQTTGSTEIGHFKSIGYEQTTAGTAPTIGVQDTGRHHDATPSPASTNSAPNILQEVGPAFEQHAAFQPTKTISAPKNGTVIQDAVSWGNKALPPTNVREKMRSMWGFRQRAASDGLATTQSGSNEAACNFSQQQTATARSVFGLPLAEAVHLCPPRGVDVNLPAVVYRCLEYLRAKDALNEEGIFRLSGSNVVIKALRERFNTEGDVDFLADDQYYDVHAVASLFKSYLRELPSTILTKELHLDFLHVLELDEKSKKISAFNILVHKLPAVNRSLLKALSQYLIEIVNNADQNKMNVRNMGIVFSPTLNIPAPVFGMFLTDFEAIFGSEPAKLAPAEIQSRTLEVPAANHLTAGDIRSPRHQMFTDLPTPSFNQTSFPQGAPPAQFPMQPTATPSNPNPSSSADFAHNTGFIPMQPSYESRTYVSDPQAPAQPQQRYSIAPPPVPQRPEYGSMNMMLAPSNAASLKAKRRESSMLFMSHRRSVVPKMPDDSGTNIVHENAAFE